MFPSAHSQGWSFTNAAWLTSGLSVPKYLSIRRNPVARHESVALSSDALSVYEQTPSGTLAAFLREIGKAQEADALEK
jgi:hypothetical protein